MSDALTTRPTHTQSEVLFVDLDGTLVASDILHEAYLLAAKHDPRILLKTPLWLLRGRAHLKCTIAELATPDPTNLPYRQVVLELIAAQKKAGARIVLATASPRHWARLVAAHLDLFDDVIASDGQNNFKAQRKLEAILAYCQRAGFETFGYVGDCSADLPIWQRAERAYAVAPSRSLRSSLDRLGNHTRVLDQRSSRLQAIAKALRPEHWVKNLLVFVPLLLAHELGDLSKFLAALIGFLAFSWCASGVYVLNDLLDIEADRRHPRKKYRPFASGTVPVTWGIGLSAGMLVAGTAAATLLSWQFGLTLAIYLVATTLYSFFLKRVALADVMLLASLYTLRILAGGAATEIVVSEWLMAFSVFLFTSLAFAKRYAELKRVASESGQEASGRGYFVGDLELIETFGPVSGYLAVLVLALYVNSDAVRTLYRHSGPLWLLCPILLYWISRIWLLARRGTLSEDPVVFAVTDPLSWLVGALAAVLLVIASSF